MIMTTIMITPTITPMAWLKRPGSTARPIPARTILATAMVIATGTAMTTAMPAIRMITPPT